VITRSRTRSGQAERTEAYKQSLRDAGAGNTHSGDDVVCGADGQMLCQVQRVCFAADRKAVAAELAPTERFGHERGSLKLRLDKAAALREAQLALASGRRRFFRSRPVSMAHTDASDVHAAPRAGRVPRLPAGR
jgi:hypothetical protein